MQRNEIIKKELLTPESDLIVVNAPLIAKEAEAGQFVVLRIDEQGERIPLTIADFDRRKGTITLTFQKIGKTTHQLGTLKVGDRILDFVGPLGKPLEIKKYGLVVGVAGGMGIAPLYPRARALKEAGNRVISIIGAKSKELLFWEEMLRGASNELHITTDDGSQGFRGFVSDLLQKLIEEPPTTEHPWWGEEFDLVVAVGPLPMMHAVAKVTKPYDIKTIVSLNTTMVDGTGMCGSCRATVGGEVKFACVDGPDFDAHRVDFEELMMRKDRFLDEEKKSFELYRKNPKCRRKAHKK